MMTARDTAVSWEGVSKEYRKGRTVVQGLDELTLDVPRGQLFGLLGPNGAGKTTSLEIAVGLRRATSGRVSCFGLDPITDRSELTRRVGVQPQEVKLFEYLSVREILDLWASFHTDSRSVDTLVERLSMGDYCDRRVASLSGGQRQRLHVALAMVGQPHLLVLDEPSAGLDPQSRRELWSLLKETRDQGLSVIMSTHSMEEAEELCDGVAIIDGGRRVAGGRPADLVNELGASRRLEFRVGAGEENTVREQVAEFGVLGRESDRMVLETADSDRALARLSAVPGVHDLTVSRRSLRDVYFASTGKKYETSEFEGNS